MSDTVAPAQNHAASNPPDQAASGKLILRGGGGPYEIEWEPDAQVTSMGSLVFFAQYLKTSGLMERFCQGTPLAYHSNNAPEERDVLGTILLSVLNGQTRYSHITTLRGDKVGGEVLGLSKRVSEDSVRRALSRGSEEEWDAWLGLQERAVYEPLLSEPYVLDIDNTVKPLYGHQEGAEVGYNPQKPGRPSHNYHTYFIGSLRIVLGVEVLPGKQSAGKHGMPGLWHWLDALPKARRPRFLRGDVSYGNEEIMLAAETRQQSYLFKLRKTSRVTGLIQTLERQTGVWRDVGEGWQGVEQKLQLVGWSLARRVIVLRRPIKSRSSSPTLPVAAGDEFDFVEHLPAGQEHDYIVLVTNDPLPLEALPQLYRDRGDCENVIDEIKNQWGWGGYTTLDLKRCQIIARLIALIYNWWNVFCRLARADQHLEAVTSRPLLLQAVGRVVTTGRRKILRLTSTHGLAHQIRLTLNHIGEFLNALERTAEQLSVEAIWAAILSAAFVKWLRGKLLSPVGEGNQTLLPLNV